MHSGEILILTQSEKAHFAVNCWYIFQLMVTELEDDTISIYEWRRFLRKVFFLLHTSRKL